MYDKLFKPISIRGMKLKNRVVLPAMGTKFAGNDRMVSDQLIQYHLERVRGGTGLSMVEVTSVHPPSSPEKYLAIGEDKYIPGLKKLTDAIHDEDGVVGVQLWQGSLAVGSDKEAMILTASDMSLNESITVKGISIDLIKEIVQCYGEAARRATEAGFDCVEIHIAHNYLPHSFLSQALNHRTDEYGGTFLGRAKFPLEIIQAVRKNIPNDMPLFIRIGAHDDYFKDGLTIEDVIEFCKLAKEAGVDVLDITRGNIMTAGLKYEVPPIDIPRGFNIDNAARIRRETGMITIGVGRINTPDLAEEVLEKEKVDLVAIGRAQLADPDFCNKAKEGKIKDIINCVGCNQGCYDACENVLIPHITCLRNPALGREAECRLEKARNPESVLIAGGGIAGLQAAITLKKRGHNPILCEITGQLGGRFLFAGEAPRKYEMKRAVLSMANQAEQLGVDIRLHTKVSKELLEELKPRILINAIGAEPVSPFITGSEASFVYDCHDVLAGKKQVSGHVIVIGGGMVGMETAEYIAERGSKVTVLEMSDNICKDLGTTRKICVTESIMAAGIEPVTKVKVVEIKTGKVIGIKDDNKIEFICDFVVLALGAKARDASELEEYCRKEKIAYFAIGDATMARRAIDATREAFDVARTFDEVYRYQ